MENDQHAADPWSLQPSQVRFMLVAPLQYLEEGCIELYRPPDDVLSAEKLGEALNQRFSARGSQNSPFTGLGTPDSVSRAKLNLIEGTFPRPPQAGEKEYSDLTCEFNILLVDHYEHFDMDILLAYVEIATLEVPGQRDFSSLTQPEMKSFEQSTTQLMREVCDIYFGAGQRAVRWVGRMAVVNKPTEEELAKRPATASRHPGIPDFWFQLDQEEKLVKLDGNVEVFPRWGNALVETGDPNYQFIDMRRAMVVAQFMWCFVADIDTRSVHLLSRANLDDVSRKAQDKAMDSLIAINFDLALASMFYERLGTESSPANRQLVEATLESWNYATVNENISKRLERTEKIYSARAEMISRRSGRLMEDVLFILSVTGLVSLILSFIGTAYSGESGAEASSWYPSGVILDFFRDWSPDFLLVASVVVTILLIIGVKIRRRR